jgi:hypothetical protein
MALTVKEVFLKRWPQEQQEEEVLVDFMRKVLVADNTLSI